MMHESTRSSERRLGVLLHAMPYRRKEPGSLNCCQKCSKTRRAKIAFSSILADLRRDNNRSPLETTIAKLISKHVSLQPALLRYYTHKIRDNRTPFNLSTLLDTVPRHWREKSFPPNRIILNFRPKWKLFLSFVTTSILKRKRYIKDWTVDCVDINDVFWRTFKFYLVRQHTSVYVRHCTDNCERVLLWIVHWSGFIVTLFIFTDDYLRLSSYFWVHLYVRCLNPLLVDETSDNVSSCDKEIMQETGHQITSSST